MHKLFPSNLYNLIFSSAAAFRSVASLPGRDTMRRLPLRSPPRVRGKVPVCCPEHRKVRITPAYAGKRDLVISGSGDIEDHPRVCGEKFTLSSSTAVSPGSPPRMRGKAPAQTLTGSASRITPACAGKRQRQSGHNEAYRDHPRVCGEKLGMTQLSGCSTGSPPRMRGKDATKALAEQNAGKRTDY